MNAFISNQKSIFRLRKDRRLFGINGSSVRNKYYLGASTANASTLSQPPAILATPLNSTFLPELRFCANRAVCYRVNTAHLLSSSHIYNYVVSRNISTSFSLLEKASSKVEESVNTIKESEKKKEQENAAQELEKSASVGGIGSSENTPSPDTSQQLATISPDTTLPVVKKTIMQRIWAEMVHYYHGFRLLFIDINVCRKYLWRIMNGKTLTRREHRLMVRTTSDLFRLLPFSVFIIVPFMELLLPIAIKLFPGMLPSTFQSASDQESKIKQNLKVKIEMAKFLQKTLDDMAPLDKDHRSQAAKDFSEFFSRVRSSGNLASNEEIIKFSKLFDDEITLDSLSRPQLLALCRVLEANCLGTTNFLRFQLRMKLRGLAADDRLIQKEGIDALNLSELQSACRARGMRAYGMSEERLRIQVQEWINLSLNEKVPTSLLLLSRALMLPESADTGDKLKATLAALPETVGTQTKAAIGEREGKIDNKTKIEIIKEEERKIKEEMEEEAEVKMEIKAKEQQKMQEAAELLVDNIPIITTNGIVKPTSEAISKMFKEQQLLQQQQQQFKQESIIPIEKELTSDDLKVLGDALGTLSKEKKTLMVEKEEIKEIKEEIAEYQEDVEELNSIVDLKKDETGQVRESRAAKNVYRKVNSMISKLDKVLADLEKKEQEIKIQIGEPALEAATESANKPEELVKVDELMGAIRKIQKVSDESVLEQIKKILGRIDDDKDGHLKVEDVLKVIETIGKENVQLNEKQLNEVIDLLGKEEFLETENKIEKALAKGKELKEEQKKLTEEANKIKEEEDFEKTESKFLLKDNATELNESKDVATKKSEDFIKKVVEQQNEKILSQMPLQPPTLPTSSTTPNSTKTSASTSPKDKVM